MDAPLKLSEKLKRLENRTFLPGTPPALTLEAEALEQQVKDLQEALDDKVRVTREISNLIDPVASGGATNPALIDVQAQLQRDLPQIIRYLHRSEHKKADFPLVADILRRYHHLLLL